MKIWSIPAATAQQFAANDYVSACTAIIDCNVALQEGFPYYIHEYGTTLQCEGVGPRKHGYYTPCNAVHEVSVHGALVEHTFTHGLQPQADGSFNTNIWVELPETVDCYVWFEYNDAGEVRDIHATLNAEGLEVNKS